MQLQLLVGSSVALELTEGCTGLVEGDVGEGLHALAAAGSVGSAGSAQETGSETETETETENCAKQCPTVRLLPL